MRVWVLAALGMVSRDVLVLASELARTRRAYADLVAACRAGMLAARDGEADPWRYVAEELPAVPAGHPLTKSGGGGAGG
jgi:hypothetical protein